MASRGHLILESWEHDLTHMRHVRVRDVTNNKKVEVRVSITEFEAAVNLRALKLQVCELLCKEWYTKYQERIYYRMPRREKEEIVFSYYPLEVLHGLYVDPVQDDIRYARRMPAAEGNYSYDPPQYQWKGDPKPSYDFDGEIVEDEQKAIEGKKDA